MYVSNKDLETINELSAFVAGAVESADGEDENGNNLVDYWLEFEKRVDNLQAKMKRQFHRQSIK